MRWLTLGQKQERFWSHVDKTDDCWLWRHLVNKDGYGQFCFNNKEWRAHRLSYTWEVGAIPDGMLLDHLCQNRACVKPGHLEPVTNAENLGRAARRRRELAGIENG